MSAETRTREAGVDLSQYHAGQMMEHSATMRAEERAYPDGRDGFGRQRYGWRAGRWQAVHHVWDRSEGSRERCETSTPSPWFSSCDAAEAWLTNRGLVIGGAYWHVAQVVEGDCNVS